MNLYFTTVVVGPRRSSSKLRIDPSDRASLVASWRRSVHATCRMFSSRRNRKSFDKSRFAHSPNPITQSHIAESTTITNSPYRKFSNAVTPSVFVELDPATASSPTSNTYCRRCSRSNGLAFAASMRPADGRHLRRFQSQRTIAARCNWGTKDQRVVPMGQRSFGFCGNRSRNSC